MTTHSGGTVLVIGGSRFIGRHTVEEFRAADYDVTIFNRGTHDNPFVDTEVEHIEGDRTDETALRAAALSVDPDVVIDCVAYHPDEVDTATDLFADARYVYVSSGDAYAREELPKREGETPLRPCSEEQAIDDSNETYGNRKAEGDRRVFAAAEQGTEAMAVRPCIVYGPHDYTARLDYWIDRVLRYDRVVVPGDGTNVWHRAYVEDVASALRTVAEEGRPGQAYNVGDRRLATLGETVELIADVAGSEVEVVHASERELSTAGLSTEDFVLYREYPHVLATNRLARLGWTSTPRQEALARAIEDHRDSDRDGRQHGPDRDAEERVLGVLETI